MPGFDSGFLTIKHAKVALSLVKILGQTLHANVISRVKNAIAQAFSVPQLAFAAV